MAQSDRTVQNATFPTVRADINDNLAALFSQSSGASAPPDPIVYQPWIDTSTSPATWKVFNGAGQWVVIGTINTNTLTFTPGGITPIANGGTGQTTASGAINALVPSQAGNASKALITDGSLVSWGSLTASQVFYYTTVGTPITWTKPSSGVVALVTIWGGGGGGGRNSAGGAGGGGGGACVQKLYQLADLPGTVTVTIGAGGNGGVTSSSNGSAGGTTTFGALLSAYGGGGGGITDGGGGGGSSSAGVAGSAGGAGGSGAGLLFRGGGSGPGDSDGYLGAFGGGAGGTSTGFGSGWGGAGGGATGGVSINGGNGGGTSVAGSVPGGGGGRGLGAAAGNGGAGAALIVVW